MIVFFQQCLVVSELVSDKVTYRAVWGKLKIRFEWMDVIVQSSQPRPRAGGNVV